MDLFLFLPQGVCRQIWQELRILQWSADKEWRDPIHQEFEKKESPTYQEREEYAIKLIRPPWLAGVPEKIHLLFVYGEPKEIYFNQVSYGPLDSKTLFTDQPRQTHQRFRIKDKAHFVSLVAQKATFFQVVEEDMENRDRVSSIVIVQTSNQQGLV